MQPLNTTAGQVLKTEAPAKDKEGAKYTWMGVLLGSSLMFAVLNMPCPF